MDSFRTFILFLYVKFFQIFCIFIEPFGVRKHIGILWEIHCFLIGWILHFDHLGKKNSFCLLLHIQETNYSLARKWILKELLILFLFGFHGGFSNLRLEPIITYLVVIITLILTKAISLFLLSMWLFYVVYPTIINKVFSFKLIWGPHLDKVVFDILLTIYLPSK